MIPIVFFSVGGYTTFKAWSSRESKANSWHTKDVKASFLRIQEFSEELQYAQDQAEMYQEMLEANKEEYDEYIESHPEITDFLDRPNSFLMLCET